MSRVVTVPAPAKINLYLHVTGRRGDGYHTLDSLIAFADAGDVVTVRPANALSLKIDGPFAASLENTEYNLVLEAAKALADYAGRRSGADICLTKNLPVAAGIGGGSADAAAAMKALATLWEIPWDEAVMGALAEGLGADVPACLAGRATFIGGIGERLDEAPTLPACGLLLANPGVQLATPSVFLARTGEFGQAARFDGPPADAATLAALLAARRNDLTEAALGLAPLIGKVLGALDAEGAHLARMSGSGTTCFGLFDNPYIAEVAGERLRRNHPSWWVAAASWADT